MKEGIEWLESAQIKQFCSTKDDVKRGRRQDTDRQATCANDIDTSEAESLANVHKELFGIQ